MDEDDFEAHEPKYPLSGDTSFVTWVESLRTLSTTDASIRKASATATDARRMKDLQVMCSPITVQSIRNNYSTVVDKLVFLAEISGTHVGFCVAMPGACASDPIFIQVVAVAPGAQRRGIGLALLYAAAEGDEQRDLVVATQDDNRAARALNEKFARELGAPMRRVNLRTYSDRNLGITRGFGYRVWLLDRSTH
ncbi:GNAT family N-acetyltransferase [Rathayibacter sp. VKM Ac-2835]|uniref:GNAT family N-acetyltransferase n=1 Tax=Rathayibacter sp. VKM Ac-2835 TaxID=2739043 RepID=UPI001565CCF9|nr:GNAT family N-acetyltransferase [Rathayibacter sp. VKM Ac-2835]NRG41331.1 GNAT family N-acetyltransferase [Rathayibacter sp. VKM Ac-2835]